MIRLLLAGLVFPMLACGVLHAETVRLQAELAAAGDYSKRMAGFGGGVVLADAFRGAVQLDGQAVGDAFASPAEPEFLIGLLTFERAHHYSASALAKVPGLQGAIGGAIKQNLALASALTVASTLEVELGDEPGLGDARIKVHTLDATQLGVTLAAFSAAQPLWSRIKSMGSRFGEAVAERFVKRAATTAALAAGPVPGSRAAMVGLLLWDIGVAAVDLAGVLTVAHALEQPAQALVADFRSDRRVANARSRVEAALAAGGRSVLRDALAAYAQLEVERRNNAYTEVAQADFTLVRRLRRHGASNDVLGRVAQNALADYGSGAALVAQSVYLEEAFVDTAFAPAVKRDFERRRGSTLAALTERHALYVEQLGTLDVWLEDASTDMQGALRDLRFQLEQDLAAEGALVTPRPVSGTPSSERSEQVGLIDALGGQ